MQEEKLQDSSGTCWKQVVRVRKAARNEKQDFKKADNGFTLALVDWTSQVDEGDFKNWVLQDMFAGTL